MNFIKKKLMTFGWILKDTKPIIPKMILIMLLEGSMAIIGVFVAISSKHMVDNAVGEHLKTAFLFAAVFSILIMSNIIINIFSSLLSIKVQENYGNNLRQTFFKRISISEWKEVSKFHSGDILTRLTSDINAITNFIVNLCPMIFSLGVRLIASFIALLYYDPRLAFLAFILGPITAVVSRIWGFKLKRIQKKIQESESNYRSFIQEAIQNLMIIKAFRLEQESYDKIQNLHTERIGWIVKKNNLTLASASALSAGYWSGYILAFSWGAWQISKKAISFGTLTAFLQLVGQVQGPFVALSRSLPQIVAVMASADRLKELEAFELEKRGEPLSSFDFSSLIFRKLCFEYDRGKEILHDLDFTINKGDIVGIIGPSGEGKTTIIRIILALMRPVSGKAFFTVTNSDKIVEISASTREWMSYVPQGNTLFSGTIADNLRYGSQNANEIEMFDALKWVNGYDFVNELPDGIYTHIGEGGLGLSEGQAQRIAIARALLRKVNLLILDEATSALDQETERLVLEGIRSRLPGCTCIIITHRPSALKICNRILKLDDGKVYEQNNP